MSTKKKYKEYSFHLNQPEVFRDIFIAELSEKGFEGFTETEDGFIAYTSEEISPDFLKEKYPVSFEYEVKDILPRNWNKKWEEQIHPLVIDNKVYIRTSFHPEENFPFVITIDPKMSFGTGHHETTELMIRQMLEMDFQEKTVLDMGAGTGVLSILAEKLGAKEITAIDIDEWAYENMMENFDLNNTKHITPYLGGATLLKDPEKFDIILANINLNILMQDFESYAKSLKKGGQLLLSGFLNQDIPVLKEKAKKFGMLFERHLEKNQWNSLRFKKSE